MQIIASFFTLGMFIVFIANVAYGFLILTIFRNYFTLININLFYSKVSGEGLVSILIIIIGLVYCLKNMIEPYIRLSVIFFMILILSSILSIYNVDFFPLEYAKKLLRVIGYMFMYLLIVKLLKQKNNLRLITIGIILSIFATCIPAFIQFSCSNASTISAPISGVMSKNNFGFFSCYMALFSIYLLTISSKKTQKIFSIFLLIICLIFLIFSYTRTAWIAFATGLIVFVVLSKSIKMYFFSFVFLITVLGSAYSIVYQGLYSDLTTKRQYGMNSFEFRYKRAWPAAIEAFQMNPIIGNGLGGSHYAMKKIGFNHTAHNDYLTILIETGVIGLVGYCIFLFYLFLISFRQYRLNADILNQKISILALTVLSAFCVGSFAEHLIQTPGATGYMFTIVGMSHGLYIAERTQSKRKRLVGS